MIIYSIAWWNYLLILSQLTLIFLIFCGLILQEEWKGKIEGAGGQVHVKIKKGICSVKLF